MWNILKAFRRSDKNKKVSFGNDAVKTFIYEKESEEATPILQRQSFTEFVLLRLSASLVRMPIVWRPF
ncbi:hypothetical protein GCK32_009620 [Trichostrongylus colubriformis]|uniref:Uncharacterized protein n=1 Tax=Trichostrongylus colubriformis TaxID=6319 RepID=A0AAN8IVQ2_TRICO